MELIEKHLHAATVERADCSKGPPQSQGKGHTSAKAEADASDPAVAVRVVAQLIENCFELGGRARTISIA